MAIKVKVTQPGLYLLVDGVETEQAIGTVLTVKEISGALVSKVVEYGTSEGKTLATGDLSEAEIQKRVDAETIRLQSEFDARVQAEVGRKVEEKVSAIVAEQARIEEEKIQAELDAEQKAADEKNKGKK